MKEQFDDTSADSQSTLIEVRNCRVFGNCLTYPDVEGTDSIKEPAFNLSEF